MIIFHREQFKNLDFNSIKENMLFDTLLDRISSYEIEDIDHYIKEI